MPSFKKRVHSQRISQRERPAVMPYEGAYDEKYSSDEDNIEYEVCEPEDLMERSNSTVTFSEDVYDSDAIEEMLKNQIRKPSQVSQESSIKGEDGQALLDVSKPSKSILKGKGGKKGDALASTGLEEKPSPPSQSKAKTVSPPEKAAEGATAGGAEVPGASGIKDKGEKGEEILGDVPEPLQSVITDTVTDEEVKGERELITKPLQSTIPQQIDQITDSSATNKNDFAKASEKVLVNVTKPLQDALSTHSGTLSPEAALSAEPFQENKLTTDPTHEKLPAGDVFPSEIGKSLQDRGVESPPAKVSPTPDSGKREGTKSLRLENLDLTQGIPEQVDHQKTVKISETSKNEKTSVPAREPSKEEYVPEEVSPMRDDAAKKAMELIADITKTVQEVFPAIATEASEKSQLSLQTAVAKDAKSAGESGLLIGSPTTEQKPQGDESEVRPESGKLETETDVSKTTAMETEKSSVMKITEAEGKTERIPKDATQETDIPSKVLPGSGGEVMQPMTGFAKVVNGAAKQITETSAVISQVEQSLPVGFADRPLNREPTAVETIGRVEVDLGGSADRDPETVVDEITKSGHFSDVSSDLATDRENATEKTLQKDSMSESAEGTTEAGDTEKGKEPSETESKPRVIFRIDSEDELQSDVESELHPPSDPSSPTGKLTEKVKQELKATLEKEQTQIEERLMSLKSGIFDISDESLLKTKELVDERLRKISDIKPPQEVEEPILKKEKSPNREVKIGRFHITPALVEEVVSRSKENEIAERLKTTRTGDEAHEEVEKELPEKLTEADLEEVIRELKKEGLKTDVYLQPEDTEKEEKKERTLKRVERRFERMASETLELDKEEGISEEKLNEKREIEFQRMVSNLSSDEVAEYQKEYLQLWEEGGLSSLTPTEDWESRDPDTPENELDDDSPKKSESFQGLHGTGKPGEPIKSSEPKKFLKSPTSPPKPSRVSDDISPKAQPLTPVDLSHVGSSPSEIDHSSGFVSERSDDIPTYSERKKFWEQMSSSQSSETAGELQRSMVESVSSVESVEGDRLKEVEEREKASVKAMKQKFETETFEPLKTPDEGSLVKSLTESYSKKIAAGELVMPAIPRPKSSASKESIVPDEADASDVREVPDSADAALVSELEVKLKSRDSGAPITESAVVSGSTQLEGASFKPTKPEKEMSRKESTDSEAEPATKSEVESKAADEKVLLEEIPIPIKDRKKVFEERSPPKSLIPKLKQDRSMSLPTAELQTDVKLKRRYFEEEMRRETIAEQSLTQTDSIAPRETDQTPEKQPSPEIEEAASSAMTELLSKGVKIAEETLRTKPPLDVESKETPKTSTLKETHVEKSETEGSEKEKAKEPQKPRKREDEPVPSITVTASGKRQPETGSIGESEDTQSESDVTPEEARVVDSGDAQWEGSGTHSGGFSPKDDIEYPKEMAETGIGRWMGQEDLSKESWEKDELDSTHFKVPTKWERTRSEGTSPKDHYVCTPEEHYPDTVWEVPVQEQLEKEEITHDIPIEKQVIIEKDEEECEEEEEPKVKLTEEEAKEIAEEILEYIQYEVENRSSFLTNDTESTGEGLSQAQVTDYLRHLAEGKDFDDQDMQLIESMLVKKQRDQLWKSQSLETTACSVDITDEELRSAGADNDISPVESQITKLQNLEEEDFPEMVLEASEPNEVTLREAEDAEQTLKDVEMVDKTLAEVKESLEAAQEQLIEQHIKGKKSEFLKKESPSEFEFKGMSYERKIPEVITEHASDWEKTGHIAEKVETIQDIKEKYSEDARTVKTDLERKISEETLRKHSQEYIKTETKDEKRQNIELHEESKVQHIVRKETTEKLPPKAQKAVLPEGKMDGEELKTLEISVPESIAVRKIGEQIYSSEDSPRSGSLEDSMRSPLGGEELPSSSSSVDKQGDKPDVLYRHSSSSNFLKTDRRSGADLEPYSSSGESHYHSFEQTSSRPCSSDVEVLLAGNIGTTGSSEYESAVSQEVSSKQQTSADYQTAVSSLSSRESIRSLDSESSGHLGSVEVSSEASETLIPSALELDKDIEAPILLHDDGSRRSAGQQPAHLTKIPSSTDRPADEDFEIISESEVTSLAGGVSEDEEGAVVTGEDALSSEEHAQRMKRSQEMTFQPEPKPIAFFDNSDGLPKETEKAPAGIIDETSSAPDERFGSSLEESGSVLSMSLSTASEPSAMRTVIELSHTDSEKMDGSLTVSATSIDSASREDIPQSLTNEMSTSTLAPGSKKPAASVTMTTSSSDVYGVPCVSTQVTSVSRKSSMVDDVKVEDRAQEGLSDVPHANGPTQVEYVADYDEVDTTKTRKSQGHRRKESTSNFVPTMMWNLSEARTQKLRMDITETNEEYNSDKYVYDLNLTEKEVKNDEKKEADDSEGYDQDLEERKVSEGEVEEFRDYDNNRPQSQISRTDSNSGRRPVSSVFSEDQPDSELSELMKQGSSETEREDPLERPLSPEPEEMENKDITPELSSEAQASVTELEMEYSGAYSRRDEYASHVSPIREERLDATFREPKTEEYLEEERLPDGLDPEMSLESTVAEKHELESGEKEILRKPETKDLPDITVTEHSTPVSSQKFQYPEPKEEKKGLSKTPDTPASTSSRTSSSSTDQGKEYNLDEVEIKKIPKETEGKAAAREKGVSESKDEKESLDSPSSDSFEMLDKPDISDEYVIIEEVGREAQENDQEGKSIKIAGGDKKAPKRMKVEEDVILSPPSPATKMTDLKYYPSEEDSELFLLDSDSPPQAGTRKFAEKLKKRSGKEEKYKEEYDQQIEQSKKWVEMQFQGEQAAKIVGAYGYEMEFERAPLEDIKEEDLNELDSSSKIGSMGSQKESLGSFGSVKDSFSSTPDFDVLAGRKYFTRSGDHDDVSMSSLQEFELIEKKLMENGKKSGSSSSQDSLNSKKLGTSSKSGQDDISTGSLKEFETLESACTTVVNMEKKAKQEEAILSEIDEGHESQISESESCETVSAVVKEKLEFDPEDFDKKMFEIDEIIRQAQSNVEKFAEMQALEKIESIGRGDSYEEVAKVPDLELDMPLSGKSDISKVGKVGPGAPYSTQVVTKKKVEEWRAAEQTGQQKASKPSELLENGGKIKSISADSLEMQMQKKIAVEGKEETISLDSYRRKCQKSNPGEFPEMSHKSDSMEEVSTSVRHHDSSSGEYTSSGTEQRPPPRAEFMLGSTDSLDPSSSTATHATYQYETDSVMSSSFTSGDSNTMVSSTDNLDLLASGHSVIDLSKDLSISKTDDWLENLQVGGNPLQKQFGNPKGSSEVRKVEFKGPDAEKEFQEYVQRLGPQEEVVEKEEVDEHGNVHVKRILKQTMVIRADEPKQENLTVQHEEVAVGSGQPFVSETVEPLQDDTYSHIVHKKVQMAPEVEKVTFRGPDAEKALKQYEESLNEKEIDEVEEVDEHGNIIKRTIIRQKVLVRPGKQAETRSEEPEVKQEKVGEETKAAGLQEPSSEKSQKDEGKAKEQVRMTQGEPTVEKIIFRGPNAESEFEEYAKKFKDSEDDFVEVEEVDEQGNIHKKKVIRQRVLIKPEKELTGPELQQYLSQLVESDSLEYQPNGLHKPSHSATEIQRITIKDSSAKEEILKLLQRDREENGGDEDEDMDDLSDLDDFSSIFGEVVVLKQDNDLNEGDLQEYLKMLGASASGQGSCVIGGQMPPGVHALAFEGPDAEEQLKEFIRSAGIRQQRQPETEEKEEVDEPYDTHIERALRKKVVAGADRELTDKSLEPSKLIAIGMPIEVQKVTFTGPDAKKQLQEFLKQQQQEPKVEEIMEVDEHGTTHIKRVLRERVVAGAERELTDKSLAQTEEKPSRPTAIGMPTEIQKVTFTGPDAEKQLQEFLKQQHQEPKVEEIMEVDEHGTTHIKRVLRETVVVSADGESIGKEFLSQIGKPDPTEGFSRVVQTGIEIPTKVEKITFKGPDAEKQLQEFIQQQQKQPETEEIEEVDEHGNVHIKRITKQRVIIRPGESPEGFTEKKTRMLTKDELQQYLDQIEEPEALPEGEQNSVAKKREEDLSQRLLTEEEFQERLRHRLTTYRTEDVDIGSTEPFVSEIIEPLDEAGFSHIIHRKVQMAPEVQKVVFEGPEADQAMKAYVEALRPGEDFEEIEEVDDRGNVHVKRILRRKIVLRPEDLEKTGLKGEELKSYLKQFELECFEGGEGPHVQPRDPNISDSPVLTEGFSSSVVLTGKEELSEEKSKSESPSVTGRKESGISQRPPLVSDISMDDEAEYDPTEHDWRHQLEILHAEADEDEIDQSLDAALAASFASQRKQ